MAFYVLAFSWIALTYGGWVLISTPETGKHSHLIGWAIVTVCGAWMFATVDHWAKYLPVLLGGGILGGLLSLSRGHLLNDSRPFPRATAAAITGLLIGCSLVAQTLAGRRLGAPDRAALIAFAVALVGAFFEGPPTNGLIGLSVGFTVLLALWVSNRYSSRKAR